MANPLTLPAAVVEALTELPRTLSALRRSADDMSAAVDRAQVLNETAERVLEAFGRAERTADKLLASGDRLVEAVERSEEFADRLITHGQELVAAAERTESFAEQVLASGEKMVESSAGAEEAARAATCTLESSPR